MSTAYLKNAMQTAESGAGDVRATVETIPAETEAGDEAAARGYARKFNT